ncbi:MAG TPA: hypothetical protein VGM44_05470, partial [Polyangiaceae bacterium]
MKNSRVWVSRWSLLGLGISSLFVVGTARAQDAPPAPTAAPAPAAAAPDLVRLKDGSMLRGTIAELKPNDFVTIVLITGETRKIPFANVDYAGSASGAPGAQPKQRRNDDDDDESPASGRENKRGVKPFVTVEGPEAAVNFKAEGEPVTLYRRAASAGVAHTNLVVNGYDELCTSPCRVK